MTSLPSASSADGNVSPSTSSLRYQGRRKRSRGSLLGRSSTTSWSSTVSTRAFGKSSSSPAGRGAGYDARAWRLARGDVRFVEVDHPATQERKKALAPPGGPEYVAADLSVQRLADALAPHLTPSQRVLITCEGLTPYLPEPAVRSLLSQAADLGPAGSRLGVEFGTKAVAAAPLRSRLLPVVMRMFQRWRGEPIQLELQQEDVPALLRETGWSLAEVFTGADLSARFLRASDPPPPPAGPALTSVWSATKR